MNASVLPFPARGPAQHDARFGQTLAGPQLAERAEPIFAAAERLFARRGYADVTLQDVADDVGLPQQHVSNYVGSMETLMLACFRRARGRLLAMLDVPRGELEAPREFLESGLAAILTFARDHLEMWQLLEEYARSHPGLATVELARGRTEFLRLLSQLITEIRVAAGRDPGGVNTETTAAAIMGSIDSVASIWWPNHPEISPAELAAQMAPGLWHGLQADFAR